MTLAELVQLFENAGCRRLYAKPLAGRDNSKNQIYLAGSVDALNILPSRQIFGANTSSGPSFKASLDFHWLLESGDLAKAPGTQLILYAQYPEVRLSGFLKGCRAAPSQLMSGREPGRVLFIGVTTDQRVIGFVVSHDSSVAHELHARRSVERAGVFIQIPLACTQDEQDSEQKLIRELRRIHDLGWIESKQLDAHGIQRPCDAPQCGGFTLEAELGIPKNSDSGPDFLGWEIKQHAVTSFERPDTGTITLLTPEPTGGLYREIGVQSFIRRFGYPDQNGRVDRLNFGGLHRVGTTQSRTGLKMVLKGYDTESKRILDSNGCVALVNSNGDEAATWSFPGLFQHWSCKHAHAAYIPSIVRLEGGRSYWYGHIIRLGRGTNPLLFLRALATGAVYYDPGIKLENASSDIPRIKRRSQFRIASRQIATLYNGFEVVNLRS